MLYTIDFHELPHRYSFRMSFFFRRSLYPSYRLQTYKLQHSQTGKKIKLNIEAKTETRDKFPTLTLMFGL